MNNTNDSESAKPRPQGDIPKVFEMEPLNSVNLFETPVSSLQHHMAQGSFTSKELVAYYLERIRRLNLYLEAVIEVNPDALDIAAGLDAERSRGVVRGPLHGIPVMVKDNMATKDKMQTTCGSWALVGSIVPRDAFVVSKLREAGAVILGHSNLTEWASMRSTEYSHGYSPRGGQVRNPYQLSGSPFDSSGGSAVCVAANMVPLALATETDGSIAGPAQINALVGIKPTPGLTSRKGVIPASETMDTIGPVAKCVADAVACLDAISGPDPNDLRSVSANVQRETKYSRFLTGRHALRGAKFGLPAKRCWDMVSDDQRKAATRVFDAMEAAGAEIIPVDYPCAEERIAEDGKWDWELGCPERCEFTIVRTEAYLQVNAYLSELQDTPIKTIEDIVKFNRLNSGSEGASPGDHPAFPSGQDGFEKIVARKGAKDKTYHDALHYTQDAARRRGIDAALTRHSGKGERIELDALILCDRRMVGQQIAAQAGYPTITLPVGLDEEGMPVAITLQQKAWREGVLVKWASAIEDVRNHAVGARPLPRYRDHLAKNIPVGQANYARGDLG